MKEENCQQRKKRRQNRHLKTKAVEKPQHSGLKIPEFPFTSVLYSLKHPSADLTTTSYLYLCEHWTVQLEHSLQHPLISSTVKVQDSTAHCPYDE